MLFGETVAVYSVRVRVRVTLQLTVSQSVRLGVEPNLGLLTRDFFFFFENHTEHTDTVRTSQETHYVSATEPNRLMLFGETVTV
jgi:hypothetical protein